MARIQASIHFVGLTWSQDLLEHYKWPPSAMPNVQECARMWPDFQRGFLPVANTYLALKPRSTIPDSESPDARKKALTLDDWKTLAAIATGELTSNLERDEYGLLGHARRNAPMSVHPQPQPPQPGSGTTTFPRPPTNAGPESSTGQDSDFDFPTGPSGAGPLGRANPLAAQPYPTPGHDNVTRHPRLEDANVHPEGSTMLPTQHNLFNSQPSSVLPGGSNSVGHGDTFDDFIEPSYLNDTPPPWQPSEGTNAQLRSQPGSAGIQTVDNRLLAARRLRVQEIRRAELAELEEEIMRFEQRGAIR